MKVGTFLTKVSPNNMLADVRVKVAGIPAMRIKDVYKKKDGTVIIRALPHGEKKKEEKR